MELDFEEKVMSLVADTHAKYETELEILKGLIRDAKNCLDTEQDAKIDYLLERLRSLRQEAGDPDLKFLIFTEFTSTQQMLKQVLEEQGGYSCGAINGSMEFEERVEALRAFKGELQILVSTDAAGESLNMQFAHIIINYDMPWNPMVVEQRIGRVDRIGQEHEVIALNLLLDNSVDKRVYEVIETKLNQILEELGIDKTADVLDSTIERDSLNRLYLTSLLNPSAFEQEGEDWLTGIREKLRNYGSTEGALPTLRTEEIKTELTDGIKFSPLPKWLEKLSTHYLQSQNLPFAMKTDGSLLTAFPGFAEQLYTFNIRESINNPIPEPLSLQHSTIQTMLSEAVAVMPGIALPIVALAGRQAAEGYWSIWQLDVKNSFEQRTAIIPLFITEGGDIYSAFAAELWAGLSTDPGFIIVKGSISPEETLPILSHLTAAAERALASRYTELEKEVLHVTHKVAGNKAKAFSFSAQQLQRIGIENIRDARLQKLSAERAGWERNFDTEKQVMPNLACLLALKVVHG